MTPWWIGRRHNLFIKIVHLKRNKHKILLYNKIQWIIPSWLIMMTVLYKVAGRVTLNAEGWESDLCLKLHIETQRKTSDFFTVTQTLLGPSTIKHQSTFLCCYFCCRPQHNGKHFMPSHCRGYCVIFQRFKSKGVQCDKASFFFHKREHNGVGGTLHSPKIPTEAHLIDVIALHPEVNNLSETGVSFSFQCSPTPFTQT